MTELLNEVVGPIFVMLVLASFGAVFAAASIYCVVKIIRSM